MAKSQRPWMLHWTSQMAAVPFVAACATVTTRTCVPRLWCRFIWSQHFRFDVPKSAVSDVKGQIIIRIGRRANTSRNCCPTNDQQNRNQMPEQWRSNSTKLTSQTRILYQERELIFFRKVDGYSFVELRELLGKTFQNWNWQQTFLFKSFRIFFSFKNKIIFIWWRG